MKTKTAIKAQILNVVAIVIGTMALIFSLVASWVIMHKSILILNSRPVTHNTTIISSIGIGLVLFWLNSLLIDSVMWTIGKCWNKGAKNG